MSEWLMLAIIVLVSVAFFADHRRNVSSQVTDVGEPDGEWTAATEPIVRPNTRPTRKAERPAPRGPVSRRIGRRTPRS